MNSGRRHLVYLSLLYHCLTLTEQDAVRLSEVYGLTIPLTREDRETFSPESLKLIDDSNAAMNESHNGFASANYCQLYFQGVRSMPSEVRKLIACQRLAEIHDLEGVPGFYVQNNRWRLNLHGSGIIKPYRGHRKRILGLFIYRSYLDSTPGLLTSEGLYKGTAAIQPIEQEERNVA